MPQLADFNGDGIVDLISGSNCCEAYAFHVWLGKHDGLFGKMQTVRFRDEAYLKALEVNKDSYQHPGWGRFTVHRLMRRVTYPNFVDWNRDGKLDLIMGRTDLSLFPNLASFDLSKWKYPTDYKAQTKYDFRQPNNLVLKDVTPEPVKNLKSLSTQPDDSLPIGRDYTTARVNLAAVRFADWDADGAMDLLAIKNHSIYQHFADEPEKSNHKTKPSIVWFRNKARTGEPNFEAPRLLYAIDTPRTYIDSIAVIDWDGDGQNEILAGVSQAFADIHKDSKPRLELLGH